MDIKLRLKQSREHAGLKQAELAKKLKTTAATISRWESGSGINPNKLQEFAKITKVPYDWLKTGEVTDSNLINIPEISPIDIKHFDNKTIAYQGRPGAYSHLASEKRFPKFKPQPYESFDDCLLAVESEKVGLTMIPIENSLGGRVADIHQLLPRSNLYIIDEHFQPVQHMLWGLPGAKLSDIREIVSHPQALAQCHYKIRSLKAKPIAFTDTAGACEYIQQKGDKSLAALASPLAGEVYKMQRLRQNMEDKLGNMTRFIVMSNQQVQPSVLSENCLTSFIFTLKSIPAALYKCLGGFATNSINLIKLESYIPITDEYSASFYAEIEGHIADKAVDSAFQELYHYTSKVKILGTMLANPRRYAMQKV